MSNVVIRVENLTKRYILGHQRSKEDGLRHLMENALRNLPQWYKNRKDRQRANTEEFYAIRNLSFELNRGDILGVIGRNGAGKSTLLKVLSRITEPTSGRITIDGRVASLLEVGTGFHPELTGRENIFLNGAILGMRRTEIKQKFDQIVEFSEVGKFLDTPVKRYSSGMYVRLAFAVAAHLEPEILIVDEVLAVGDAAFQKKCLGKMKDVAGHGRTVIFVSHNIGAVRALCNTGILLTGGTLSLAGPIDTVTAAYVECAATEGGGPVVSIETHPEHCRAWIKSISILKNGTPNAALEFGDLLSLSVEFEASETIKDPLIGYLIKSSQGENVINGNNRYQPFQGHPIGVKHGRVLCNLGKVPLMAGNFSVSFWFGCNLHEIHHIPDVLHFTVEEKNIWGTSAMPTKGHSCMWWQTEFSVVAT